MTTIATFTTPEDAHLFKAYLGSQGIEAHLADEHFVQLFWHYSNAIGGVRVTVAEDEVDAASEAYRTYMEGLRAGPYPLNPVRGWPAVILVSLLIGAPFLFFGRRSAMRRG